ncbi:MAG TPA: hypothetical protein VFB00_04340 [Terriglobales bacterium]|nr:hypothetical protein [Terriglobales bacterium]
MLALFWVALVLPGAYILLLMTFLVGMESYERYRGSRPVICPESRRQVSVGFDARLVEKAFAA